MDFLLQNSLMFLYFFYYITQSFMSEPLRKAYLVFFTIYIIASILPHQISTCCYERYIERPNESLFFMILDFFFRIFLSCIHGKYLWAFFFYSLHDLDYYYKEPLVVSTGISRIAQTFLQVTMITVLAVNEVDNGLKKLTICLSIFQSLFNILVTVCIIAK